MTVVVIAMTLSVLIAAMTAAAARGLLKANGAVGIRTAATMRSQEAWRVAHARALPTTVLTAAIVVAAGIVLLLVGLPEGQMETAGGILTAVTVVGVIGAAVIAHRAAQRVAAAERHA
ncbi:SdpI family protein [Frigoribacterium faeni]|uniref:SdpI family protein n=1 Tax=Frigoribacterium faeni TaxID=145483 RepID=UPI00141B1CA9|nr:SdpI family protein [Frigoribacterium faeni]NIJ05473.1 putative membrane protein [Frigoribacterium faeni]